MPEELENIEKMDYEHAFAALQEVVRQLEEQELPLETSMQLFEKGQLLAKHCDKLLEKAELKVEQLLGGQAADSTEEAE